MSTGRTMSNRSTDHFNEDDEVNDVKKADEVDDNDEADEVE